MTNRFEKVQAAANARLLKAIPVSSQEMAAQIVKASCGDTRAAYDFLDTLTKHVGDLLKEQ